MAEPSAAASQDKKTYRGNCHCGAFVFEATIPEIKEVMVCNCSICYKKNYAFALVPDADFKVVKGDMDADLTTYKFGAGSMAHMFCSKCGIAVVNHYTNMPGTTAINVRAVQGPIDVWTMPKKTYDGKALEPAYVPPSYDSLGEPARKFDEAGGGKLYHGSCHCGDVTVALRVAKPLDEDTDSRVVECNCSICQRTGATWFYPNRDQLVFKMRGGSAGDNDDNDRDDKLLSTLGWAWGKRGLEGVGAYRIRLGCQVFCRRCGVFLANRLDLTEEAFGRLPEKLQKFLADKREWQPVNLRIFDGLDVGDLKVQHEDGWNKIEPKYTNP